MPAKLESEDLIIKEALLLGLANYIAFLLQLDMAMLWKDVSHKYLDNKFPVECMLWTEEEIISKLRTWWEKTSLDKETYIEIITAALWKRQQIIASN